MIIDCISDLNGYYPELEGGDLLIVAGDWTKSDGMDELEKFEKDWLRHQPYKKIILIAGNHDYIAYECGWVGRGKIEYLCDSGTEFEDLKIWGSPWSKTFEKINPHCKAFTVDTEEELSQKWALIPDDIDILVTHSPPFCCLDSCFQILDSKVHCVGSTSLEKQINKLKNLKLHVFGHIHEHGGKFIKYIRKSIGLKEVLMVNASHVNERYEPVNKPMRVIL